MKIILLNLPWIENEDRYGVKSGARWASVRYRDRTLPYFPFPFSLAYTTSLLKTSGYDALLLDAIAEGKSRKWVYDFIKEQKPDLIILDTSTPSIYSDLEFSGIVKRMLNIPIALCGPHASALPNECIKQDGANFVLIGEMEHTALELVKAIEVKNRDYHLIDGLAYWDKRGIKVNKRRELISDLDSLPYPERESLRIERYTDPTCKRYPNISIISSRGCPHHCIYCLEPSVFYGKANYRVRKPSMVVDEIEYLIKQFHVREIYFDDSSFTTSIKHARDISQEIIDRGISVYWSCMADARTDKDTLLLMKKSGCHGVKFGVESADEEILKSIKKPLDLEQVKGFISLCNEIGLYTHATYMFGLPGETRQSIRKTIDFAFSLGTTTAQFSLATPYPRTEFYDYLKKNGFLLTSDYRNFEGGNSSVISYPNLDAKEIESAVLETRRRKMIALIKNPLLLVKYLNKLSKIEGWNIVSDIIQKGKFLLKKD